MGEGGKGYVSCGSVKGDHRNIDRLHAKNLGTATYILRPMSLVSFPAVLREVSSVRYPIVRSRRLDRKSRYSALRSRFCRKESPSTSDVDIRSSIRSQCLKLGVVTCEATLLPEDCLLGLPFLLVLTPAAL